MVLLAHGRNGAPDQPQIAVIAETYLARGWAVVAPELPNSIALPLSGPAEHFTMSVHRRSVAEVWAWAAERWRGLPMALAGHSLGGFAAAHLAPEARPHHLLGVSPVLSGPLLLAARIEMGPDAVAAMEREVPLMRAEIESEDATVRLAGYPGPVGVVSGAEDGIVPRAHARAYFDAAPDGRFFGLLPGQHHCPQGPDCARMLSAALDALAA